MIARVYRNLAANQWARFVFGAGLGIIVWKFSSSAVQDIIVFGAFAFALFFAGRGKTAWLQPAGVAFIGVVLYHLFSLPFSLSPEMSIHDTIRILEIAAGAFAIPVIFNSERKIAGALFCSAAAIALVLGYDLVRMSYHLGAGIFAGAHSFQPFILNHSNVASMMAGMAFFVFYFFLLKTLSGGIALRPGTAREQESRFPIAVCLAGGMVCLVYLVIAASRGPQLAFALAFAATGLILPGWKSKAAWMLAIVAAGVVVFYNFKHVNPRFAEKSTMVNFSERDRVWKHTWRLVQERPWFGHGYGKNNFETIYYASQPPRANYHFPHPHQYWLKLLFEYGWAGTGLYLAAWILLFIGLARSIYSARLFAGRMLPGAIAAMLVFIHLYGLGDYPDNIVRIAQFWLIPAALVVIQSRGMSRL